MSNTFIFPLLSPDEIKVEEISAKGESPLVTRTSTEAEAARPLPSVLVTVTVILEVEFTAERPADTASDDSERVRGDVRVTAGRERAQEPL